jgi:hypothetical protein
MGGKTKPTKHTAKELARNVFRAASGRRWHEAPNPKNVCAGPCFDSKQLPWTHVIRRSLCVFGAWRIHHCRNATRSTVHEEEEEEDLFVFNDTVEGPRAPAVKPGRITQA